MGWPLVKLGYMVQEWSLSTLDTSVDKIQRYSTQLISTGIYEGVRPLLFTMLLLPKTFRIKSPPFGSQDPTWSHQPQVSLPVSHCLPPTPPAFQLLQQAMLLNSPISLWKHCSLYQYRTMPCFIYGSSFCYESIVSSSQFFNREIYFLPSTKHLLCTCMSFHLAH